MNFGPNTGLELIARAMTLQLVAGLNDALAEQDTFWAPYDVEYDLATGLNLAPTTLEEVPVEEFHMGHVPELINAPVERYPNVSVMGTQATPLDGNDHTEEWQDTFAVEVMVKSLESQEHVNRRILRTTEAVNNVIMADPTLGGLLSSYRGGLKLNTVNVSDVFIKRRFKGREDIFWWQGARLDYSCRKPASYLG